MNIKKEIVWRVYVAFILICLGGGAIFFKATQIQVKEGEYWRSLAENQTTAYISIEAERGNVLSGDGRLLATSLPFFEIRMDPGTESLTDEIFFEHVDSLAFKMAEFFQDKSQLEYKRQLVEARRSGNRFMLVMRNANYQDLIEMKQWPLFRKGRFRGGFIAIQQNRRVTPFQMLAHRTIGYVREGVQPVGIEGAFDEYLSGVEGKRLMQRIAGSTWMPINDEDEIQPQHGKDIITTLDINLQDVVENALYKAVSRHRASHGSAVLMEVSTGKIKAIANIGEVREGRYWEKYNYAVGEGTEPGSTMKTAAIIALLEDGYIHIHDSVNLHKGRLAFFDQTMRDAEEHNYETVTLKRAFEISSNVGISKLVQQYYGSDPQRLIDHFVRMRLDQQVGIEIKGEATPLIKNPQNNDWSGTTLPWMSVGYEMQLAPIQILTFYNAIANGGIMLKPYLVQEIQQYGRTIKSFDTEVMLPRLCSERTLKDVQYLLESVMDSGTGRHLQSPLYRAAGKTGTAQIADAERGYSNVYQSSFVGYFPADDPVYSCIVTILRPRSGIYYGGHVAGPVFKEIADHIYSTSIPMHQPVNLYTHDTKQALPVAKAGYAFDATVIYDMLGIKYQADAGNDWVKCSNSEGKVVFSGLENTNGKIPDVRGMGLRDAVFILENSGLQVEILGNRGRVLRQSVPPGRDIGQNRKITITLG